MGVDMHRLFHAALALSLALAPGYAAAQNTVRITNSWADNNSPGCTAGICIQDGALTSTLYTGKIHTGGWRAATIGVTFTDANDSVTALNVQCYTRASASGTDGTGFEICSGATAAGTTTLTCPHVWTLTTGTAEKFAFTVDNLNSNYLNCAFSATGTPAAADVITVKVQRKSP